MVLEQANCTYNGFWFLMDPIVLELEPKTLRLEPVPKILDTWSWNRIPKFEFRLTALLSIIVDDINFLAVNELSFMGTEDLSLLNSGFFLQLMEFSFKEDEKLLKISRSIPNNEKYTCPEI